MSQIQQKLFDITHGRLNDDDLKFVQEQWGLVTTYIREQHENKAVVREGDDFYDKNGTKLELFGDPYKMYHYESYIDKKIWFLTEAEYEFLFCPF